MLLLSFDHLPKLCCVRACAVGVLFPATIGLALYLLSTFTCQVSRVQVLNLKAKSENSDSVAIDLQKLKDVLQNDTIYYVFNTSKIGKHDLFIFITRV